MIKGILHFTEVGLHLWKIHFEMKKLILSLIAISIITACNENRKKPENPQAISTEKLTVTQQIANKNGFENWENVSEIKFTFNVGRGENHSERSWVWKPKTNEVTMISKTDTVNYNRNRMDSITKQTDAAFINDKYWLLAPLNLAWDEGISFSEKQNSVAPISKDTLNQLTIVYGNEGGYTPGDAYDFFYDKNFIIREWTFRQGNDSLPTMSTTWEDYENFNGITISKTRTDGTGNFKLYFTNITVK